MIQILYSISTSLERIKTVYELRIDQIIDVISNKWYH